ncbi:MAG: CHAD domain-containing protein [Rubrivivax sp.]|nr:CHAD domain-containing protein [Rubrivivax sp.]
MYAAAVGPNDRSRRRRKASRRLRRWHARIVADWKFFDEIDDDGLRELRKRIKRQRYAVEFFAPLLRRRLTAAEPAQFVAGLDSSATAPAAARPSTSISACSQSPSS